MGPVRRKTQSSWRFARRLRALILVLVLAPFLAAADDTAKQVSPEEAAKQANEKVTLRMEVKAAALRNGVCFLNSQEDFKDAKNFTVFIGKDALQKFQEATIDDPAAHFKGETVLVTGKVTLYREKPQIAGVGPDQIKVEE
jgi:DNA/RNA endonuclease YhcR with UshA esterase domain